MSRRRLRNVLQRAWGERWLLLEATACLGIARLALLMVPFRWMAPYLGQQQHETPATDQQGLRRSLRRIGRTVATMSRHTPWENTCLVQALAAKIMLKRRGICSTLYLGAAKAGEGLAAHAWLRSGSVIVTGGPGRERFTVISTFADRGE